jgi:hypothetical protein
MKNFIYELMRKKVLVYIRGLYTNSSRFTIQNNGGFQN